MNRKFPDYCNYCTNKWGDMDKCVACIPCMFEREQPYSSANADVVEECEWKEVKDRDYANTTCGQQMYLNIERRTNYKYCPYCGKLIRVVE